MQVVDHHRIGNDSVDHLNILAVEEPGHGGAYHHYVVSSSAQPPLPGSDQTHVNVKALADIHFQEGPIKEAGVNGITQEALIAICMDRLEGFQAGPYPSADNMEALQHLAMAMECLQRRTRERLARGVEGTSQA